MGGGGRTKKGGGRGDALPQTGLRKGPNCSSYGKNRKKGCGEKKGSREASTPNLKKGEKDGGDNENDTERGKTEAGVQKRRKNIP